MKSPFGRIFFTFSEASKKQIQAIEQPSILRNDTGGGVGWPLGTPSAEITANLWNVEWLSIVVYIRKIIWKLPKYDLTSGEVWIGLKLAAVFHVKVIYSNWIGYIYMFYIYIQICIYIYYWIIFLYLFNCVRICFWKTDESPSRKTWDGLISWGSNKSGC